MAAFTRYRRERQEDPTSCIDLTECPSALVFNGIDAVKHKCLDKLAEGKSSSCSRSPRNPVAKS